MQITYHRVYLDLKISGVVIAEDVEVELDLTYSNGTFVIDRMSLVETDKLVVAVTESDVGFDLLSSHVYRDIDKNFSDYYAMAVENHVGAYSDWKRE